MRTSLAIATLVCALTVAAVGSQAPRFYDDDPISREPEPQDASKAEPWDIGLLYDLSYQLFATSRRKPSNTRAQNINTIDEVPDSSWFTNRIGARALSVDEVLRGTNLGPPPSAERWTVTREKSSGFAPGFTARGAKGETWFLSFDPPSNPEGATGALAIANRIFWALGYNQVETFLTSVDPRHIDIDPAATTRRPSGERSPLTQRDLDEVLERAAVQRRTARIAPPRRDCCRARSSAASATKTRARTTPTTSSRTSIGASCARCACSARGPTSPT